MNILQNILQNGLLLMAATFSTFGYAQEETDEVEYDKKVYNLISKNKTAFENWQKQNPTAVVNLKGADLSGKDLSGLNLSGAIFEEADLRGAKLLKANLSKANFKNADMGESDANLTDFSGSNIEAADFSEADVTTARFHNVKAKAAIFRNSEMSGANFRNADLTDADFTSADLSGAVFSETTVIRTLMQGAELEEISVTKCKGLDKAGKVVELNTVAQFVTNLLSGTQKSSEDED